MKVRFWGVRGSIPTPLTPEAIRSKIATVLQRVKPEDLVSAERREQFLANLPPWLFGTVGGNTSCIEISFHPSYSIILDGGSGLRELGVSLSKRNQKVRHFHIFFSHFHWDHLQGIPFFHPLFDPECHVHFYSPVKELKSILEGQMNTPYFPVPLSYARATLKFHLLQNSPISFPSGKVVWKQMNHPGGCYAYQVTDGKSRVIYATDSELTQKDFERNKENIDFFEGVDAIILDSQYTLGEAVEKYNWGHSSFSLAVDFAAEWNMKRLYLFHHEPLYNDKKIHNNLQSARWYYRHLERSGLEILLAEEGLEFDI